jgi:phosphoribosylaminoimidazole-succinocarboxamide synthase
VSILVNSEHITSILHEAFQDSHLPLPDKSSGKVRDWYPLAEGKRLIVTTDRLSAFDRVLASVPFKGQVLNQLSNWWFENTQDIVKNHIISAPDPNAVIVNEATPILVEVIVRGYITGVTSTALWYRYSLGEREIYGYLFPEGLKKNQKLPQPIITPTTKGGETGHDERLTCDEVVKKGLLDQKTWDAVQTAALNIFKRGQEVAERAGIILVDTKYEFGLDALGQILLIDEVHTPDSSRFWKLETYQKRFDSGEEPDNFDKEFIRMAYAQKNFRGDGIPPVMPDSLWISASQRYIQIYEMLTGKVFQPGSYPVNTRLVNNIKKAGVIS